MAETRIDPLRAAELVKPHHYYVTNIPSEKIHFLPLGCIGEGGKTPKEIVLAIDEYIDKHPEIQRDTFIFILTGDVIYPRGVTDYRSNEFQKKIYAIFANPELK